MVHSQTVVVDCPCSIVTTIAVLGWSNTMFVFPDLAKSSPPKTSCSLLRDCPTTLHLFVPFVIPTNRRHTLDLDCTGTTRAGTLCDPRDGPVSRVRHESISYTTAAWRLFQKICIPTTKCLPRMRRFCHEGRILCHHGKDTPVSPYSWERHRLSILLVLGRLGKLDLHAVNYLPIVHILERCRRFEHLLLVSGRFVLGHAH